MAGRSWVHSEEAACWPVLPAASRSHAASFLQMPKQMCSEECLERRRRGEVPSPVTAQPSPRYQQHPQSHYPSPPPPTHLSI